MISLTLRFLALWLALLQAAWAQLPAQTAPQIAPAAGSAPAVARPRSEPLEADRIVAVVGNEAITLHELQSRLRQAIEQMKRQGTPLPDDPALQKQLQRQMLERMILDRAQMQLARESGLNIDDPSLDATIQEIVAGNNMSLEQFRQMLQKEGIPFASYREGIRQEMLIGRVREREVISRITVSDAEVEHFLSSQQAVGNAEYHMAHILLRAPEAASPETLERLRQKAEQVLGRARQGESFAQLAASFSDAPDALKGGDMGWRKADQLPTLFAEQAGKLKAGEVGPILRSANGFHLLKLLEQRGGMAVEPVLQTHVRHILIRVNEGTSETEARRRLENLRDRLLHGANFAEQARLYGQDGTSPQGGDLGWIYPGDTVPEFERAMNALKPNEISQPVQTPFGFHLIQVLERQKQGASPERLRKDARKAVLMRKADDAYQDWLRQLRDRTYVEVRLDEQ